MKKNRKILVLLITFVLLAVLAGCGDKKNGESAEPENTKKPQTASETQEETTEEDGKKETSADSRNIYIYVPGENADGWDVREEEIQELSPDALIGYLVGAGALPDSVTVQNFEETKEEGKYLLKLDLSSNFQENLSSMGTTEEILTMGAVVNTFLDTYEAEGIQITVNGDVLTSGHEEYSGYLSHIEY